MRMNIDSDYFEMIIENDKLSIRLLFDTSECKHLEKNIVDYVASYKGDQYPALAMSITEYFNNLEESGFIFEYKKETT